MPAQELPGAFVNDSMDLASTVRTEEVKQLYSLSRCVALLDARNLADRVAQSQPYVLSRLLALALAARLLQPNIRSRYRT